MFTSIRSIIQVMPGDILYINGDTKIMIAMVGVDGVRYIEPNNIIVDDVMSIITNYISFSELAKTADMADLNVYKK